jgi:hypothetical protein
MATITVDTDISTAPSAGESRIPATRYRAPAAARLDRANAADTRRLQEDRRAVIRGRAAILAVAIPLAPLVPLRAQGIAYEGGIAVTTGKYFYTTRTTSWTIATGLAYRRGRFTFRATLPVYVQNSSLVRGSGAGMFGATWRIGL